MRRMQNNSSTSNTLYLFSFKTSTSSTTTLRISRGSVPYAHSFVQKNSSNTILVVGRDLIHRFNPFRNDIVPQFYYLLGQTKRIGKCDLAVFPMNYRR